MSGDGLEVFQAPGGGGGPGSVEVTFVVDPTVAPHDNIYVDLLTAAAAASLVRGPRWVSFPVPMTGANQIPAGIYDFGPGADVTFTTPIAGITIDFADGCTLRAGAINTNPLLEIYDLLVIERNIAFTGSGPLIQKSSADVQLITLAGTTILDPRGDQPIFRVAAGIGAFLLEDNAVIGSFGVSGTPAIDWTGAGVAVISVSDLSYVNDNMLAGANANLQTEIQSSAADISQLQAGITGASPAEYLHGTYYPGAGGIAPEYFNGVRGVYYGEDFDPATGIWLDSSGNGNHLTDGGVANRPTAGGGLDGHPTVAFTGAGVTAQVCVLPAGLQRGLNAAGGGPGANQASSTFYAVFFSTLDAAYHGLYADYSGGVIGVGGIYLYGNTPFNEWGVYGAGNSRGLEGVATFKQVCASLDMLGNTSPADLWTSQIRTNSITINSISNLSQYAGVLGADGGAPFVGITGLEGEIAFFAVFDGRHDPGTAVQIQKFLAARFPSLP